MSESQDYTGHTEGSVIKSIFRMGLPTMIGFGADNLMRVFFEASGGEQSARVHEAGVILLKVFAFSFPFIGLFITIEQVFCGAGKNVPGMVLSIVGNWVLEIPLILLLAHVFNMQEVGVWFGITISAAIGAFAFYWYYTRRTWLSHRVKSLNSCET